MSAQAGGGVDGVVCADEGQNRENACAEKDMREVYGDVENRMYLIGECSVVLDASKLCSLCMLKNVVDGYYLSQREEGVDDKCADEKNADEKGVDEKCVGEEVADEKCVSEKRREEWRRKCREVVEKYDPEIVVVEEQAVATTMTQARLFASFDEVDDGRLKVVQRNVSVVRGDKMVELLEEMRNEEETRKENDGSRKEKEDGREEEKEKGKCGLGVATEEKSGRVLYPYSFGRPERRMVALLRVVVLLFVSPAKGEERGVCLSRESFTVVDTMVKRGNEGSGEELGDKMSSDVSGEKECEKVELGSKEWKRVSYIYGPEWRKDEKEIVASYKNVVKIVLDMSGNGHTRNI